MSKTSLPEDRIPVIVGVGEIVDRPTDIAAGLEPLTLLEQAVRRAEADSGAKLIGELGSLDIVNFLSWRYRDPEKLLAARLGVSPAHNYYGPVGGESPIRYIHASANSCPEGHPVVSGRLVSLIHHGRAHTGTGISTRCPSTTPVGLALGPDSPWAD